MDSLLGGSSGGSESSSQSGFALLPQELQKAWTQYGSQLTNQFGNSQADKFTPLPLTSGEQSALGSMTKGYTPTASSLASNIAMQSNPFDQSVIDTMNREAAGKGSVLNTQLNNAGQFGSNRGELGANDIDLTRLQQIGSFKQNQFNTALDNALTKIPGLQQASDQAALQAGGYGRQIDTQTKQAPISALQAYANLLGVVPKDGGSTSNNTSSNGSSSGIGSLFSSGQGGTSAMSGLMSGAQGVLGGLSSLGSLASVASM